MNARVGTLTHGAVRVSPVAGDGRGEVNGSGSGVPKSDAPSRDRELAAIGRRVGPGAAAAQHQAAAPAGHTVRMRGPGNAKTRGMSHAICECGWENEVPWGEYEAQDKAIQAHWAAQIQFVCERCSPGYPGEHWQNCLHFENLGGGTDYTGTEKNRRCKYSTGNPQLYHVPGLAGPRWMTPEQAAWSTGGWVPVNGGR